MVSATKKTGRQATDIGTPIQVHLQPTALAALDAYIRRDVPDSTRPQAIRRIISAFLLDAGAPPHRAAVESETDAAKRSDRRPPCPEREML